MRLVPVLRLVVGFDAEGQAGAQARVSPPLLLFGAWASGILSHASPPLLEGGPGKGHWHAEQE
jgi:hypothetical protein